MLTPAMSASSTSSPFIIISNAVSTHVFVPPFLNWWPLPEAMTTGRVLPCTITAGPRARTRAGAPPPRSLPPLSSP